MARIHELRQAKADMLKRADDLAAKEDDDSITEDELQELEGLTAANGDLEKLNARIAREERLMEERRSMEAVGSINEDTDEEAEDKVPATAKKEPEKFKSLGEQLQAVARAGMVGDTKGTTDSRLIWGAATGAGEAVPSEGGFLVQQDFSTTLLDLMHETGVILSRVRRIPISGNANGLKLPMVDEKSRVDGSRWGGVRGYWANEGDSVTASQPKFKSLELSLEKLMGLGYATDELLSDAVALEAVMSQAFTEEMTFKTEDAVINGTGAGQPLGILNSGAVVSIAKDSGQAAATITTTNVLQMFARLTRRSAPNAVWLVNQDTWPQLFQLTLGSGTAVVLLYRPPGVDGPNVGAPFGTLLGRPVLPVEYCATLGTVGDILLVDLMQYIMIDKGGVDAAQSMHVRFVNDEMTFRWIYRVDGQPAWSSPVTPYKGANTQSPFISLATRA